MRYPHIRGATGREAAQVEIPPKPNGPGCVSILVVDDNARYRTQLQRMIGKLCPQANIYVAESIQDTVQLTQRVGINSPWSMWCWVMLTASPAPGGSRLSYRSAGSS